MRVMRGSEMGSDHNLLVCHLRKKGKRQPQRRKSENWKRTQIKKGELRKPAIREEFRRRLGENLEKANLLGDAGAAGMMEDIVERPGQGTGE